ncbi:aldehyde dehydrogenase family protein [Halomicronema sp. CCY15110]|uniref:aldehyde dehydrogenase family protein n=1 Tax=Halomicronema sp. CCY15110 TaxID=2767773 RepID=UPI00194F3950|nr:aldehyde dehydrogenase family protein [Halomicronema sp. CCY15110]
MQTHLSIINPATATLVKEIPIDDATTIQQKAAAARQAQPAWAGSPLAERIAAIARFRDLLGQRQADLAATLTAETGKPITQSNNELATTQTRLNFFIDHVAQVLAPDVVHQEPIGIPGTGDLEEVISYDPLGVIANISAWNYPYFVGSNVFIPALLTGNAVLYKPSEFAALTGLAIADLLHTAGIPEDIFVPIIGGGATGATLLEQPLNGVFFTGSYTTGKKIAAAAAAQLAKVQLELGGKDPAYICDDVPDVAAVAAAVADGSFYNNGQSCCAIERIYVHAAIYEEFLAAYLETVQGFVMGDPTDPNTYLGPISRQIHLDELERQVKDAVTQGATLHCGGHRIDGTGWYFAPTVLTEVTHDMAVMRDETFGPVIGIQKVESDAEAISLMNDTDYGLTAAVYSADRSRAIHILGQINSGTAYWNCCDRVSPQLPWSGRGHSGVGTTLSLEGIRTFTQPRGWHLRQ